jgi:hypothetical protein
VGEKGVAAVGFELFVGDHDLSDSEVPRRAGKSRVLGGESGLGIGAGVLKGLEVAGIFDLFSRAVNGIGGFAELGQIFRSLGLLSDCAYLQALSAPSANTHLREFGAGEVERS